MIQKENIKKIIIDVEGSSFVKFETDLKLDSKVMGDFYWQGDEKFFEVNMYDLVNDRDEEFEDESILDYLSEEAVDYIKHLADYELADFI